MTPGSILIVDDSEANRILLSAILQAEGYVTLEAGDGSQAHAMAVQHSPDLVLLDIMMPGGDGREVCVNLKRDDATSDIPVIFLSSLSSPRDKISGLARGAVDYVTKPFDAGEVLARVRTQLRTDSLRKQLVESNRYLSERQERIDCDLRAAAGIQRLLLPDGSPDADSVAVGWRFEPCETVGGDLLQVTQIDDRYLAAYVVDVAGHGVPAAMMTVAVAQSLRQKTTRSVGGVRAARSRRPPGPREVLDRLDREFPLERFERGLTICYVLLDLRTGQLWYSRAGHPRPALVRAGGQVEFLDEGGAMIGLDGFVPFEEGVTRLGAGDRVYLYSDGVTERTDGVGALFGEGGVAASLLARRGSSVRDVCDAVVERCTDFGRGGPLDDDVSVLGIEFCPPGPEGVCV